MAETTSWAFPNIFNVAQNCVGVLSDSQSLVNRSRLLILTEPTELYNNPDFGVGLKRYLWQYNTANTRAIIQDRIKDQLNKYEPYVDASATQFLSSLISDDRDPESVSFNELDMSVGLVPTFGEPVSVDLNPDLTKSVEAL